MKIEVKTEPPAFIGLNCLGENEEHEEYRPDSTTTEPSQVVGNLTKINEI